MNKIKQFLQKEHSRSVLSLEHKTLTIYFFFVVFTVMVLFKPYVLGMYSLKPRLIVALYYSILSTIGLWVIRLINKTYIAKKHTMRDEVILVSTTIFCAWLLCYLFTISFLDFFIKAAIGVHYNAVIPPYFFICSLLHMYIFGLIVYAFLRLYDLVFLLSVSEDNPKFEKLIEISPEVPRRLAKITFEGKNKGEFLELDLKKLVYIKSDGHYVGIYFLNHNNILESKLLRISLKEVEKKTQPFRQLQRCHRSHILNLHYLKSITSYSNKFHGLLINELGEIPISKDKYDIITELQKTL